MVKKYIFIFFLLLSLISCQQNHKSQNVPNGNISKNIVKKRGYILNISALRLKNLLEIDPNLMLVDVTENPENDSIIKAFFLPKYIHIPASIIYSNPDTLPQGKSVVLISFTGEKSQKLAYFLVGKGKTVYNLVGGIRVYKIWLKKKKNKAAPNYDADTIIEKHDFGC
jgi:rhodanese-related sulfurtransferase